MILKDTSRFQEVWHNFLKNDGVYCPYTKDSYAYKEFWMREHDRCLNGYKINDLWIPGTYYFYLNYFPIIATDEKIKRKGKTAPRFTDVDLEYFMLFERAREESKGIILAKPRRTGFSFKNASLIVHEYNFYKEAKCVIGAYLSDLSTNTMNMCIDGLNWLDKHTEWKKQRNPDTRSFVKARYKETIDGIDIWKGYNSQIETVTFKDNPFASIGKSCNMFIFEEGGKFPNLIESYNISEPCWKDGEDMIGIPVIYGCMMAGSKVWNNDGDLINIENLTKEEGILGFGKSCVSKENISWMQPPAQKPCYKITTTQGTILECSEDHPILWSKHRFSYTERVTKDGKREIIGRHKKVKFKEAKEIVVGDHLVSINSIPIFKNEPFWESRLVGMLIGDGSYRLGGSVRLSNCDVEINNYVDSKFDTKIEKEYLTKDNKLFRETRIRGIVPKLRELGIYGQTKNNKRLPKSIFRASKEDVCELLSGLIDTDGYIINKDNNKAIILTSSCEELIREIRFLFTKIGVHGSITKIIADGRVSSSGISNLNDYYRLVISDNISVINAANNLKLLCNYKQKVLNSLKEISTNTKYSKCAVFTKKSEQNKRTINTEEIEGIRFETVKSIEYLGLQDIYNLTADTTHTYIANNIITHNTGGDMEGGTIEFAEMFYNPEKYNLLSVDNIWDDDKVGTKCGWFVPANRMRFGKFEYEGKTVDLVDADGNSNIEAATASIMKLREMKSKSGVDKDFRDTITQYPLKPSEAFLRTGYNKFPVAELQEVLGKIESKRTYEYDEKYVELYFDPNAPRGINYNIIPNAKPLVEYPVKEVDRTGCLIVYEFPIELPDGTTPPELYMIAHDPTRTNEETGESLAGIQVFKTHKYFTQYGQDEIVAEFYGRRDKDDINEILEKLCMWYGLSSKMLFFEANVGNTMEYFQRKKKLHYLATRPQYIFNKKGAFSGSGTLTYGYEMENDIIKGEAEDYLNVWLKEKRGESEIGEVKNLHVLKSRMLLKQLISYNKDGNFDAVSTALMWASGRRERFNVYEREKVQEAKKHALEFLAKNPKVFKNKETKTKIIQ